jgi:replication factor C subunit 3/5
MALLHHIYGPSALKTIRQKQVFEYDDEIDNSQGSAGKKKRKEKKTLNEFEMILTTSRHHIECNPSSLGPNKDYLIMSRIKSLAKEASNIMNSMNSAEKKDEEEEEYEQQGEQSLLPIELRKVIIIHDMDKVSKKAQHCLLRTMEKNWTNCYFILIAQSCSKVLPAIISRCQLVRIPRPEEDEITKIIDSIIDKEEDLKDHLDLLDAKRLASESGRNVRKALLLLSSLRGVDQERVVPFKFDTIVDEITSKITFEQKPSLILQLEKMLTSLIDSGINPDIIIKSLVKSLLAKIIDDGAIGDDKKQVNGMTLTNKMKFQTTTLAARYQYGMVGSVKPIIHLQAFLIHFMADYQQYLSTIF